MKPFNLMNILIAIGIVGVSFPSFSQAEVPFEFSKLLPELQHDILSFLKPSETGNFALTSHSLYELRKEYLIKHPEMATKIDELVGDLASDDLAKVEFAEKFLIEPSAVTPSRLVLLIDGAVEKNNPKKVAQFVKMLNAIKK